GYIWYNYSIINITSCKCDSFGYLNWVEDLIFIGDEREQINWAQSKIGKLILVKGGPIELTKKLNKQVFLTKKAFSPLA
ncbi:MAG: hypothetical protein AB8V19_05110, partial [Candidatus Midichloria sp.]